MNLRMINKKGQFDSYNFYNFQNINFFLLNLKCINRNVIKT